MSAVNTAHHSSIGESPYFVLFHRDPTLPFPELCGIPIQNQEFESTPQRLERIKDIYKLVRSQLVKAYDKYSSYYNARAKDKRIGLGSKVYKKLPKPHGPTRKFKEVFVGPYRVIEVMPNEVTFRVKHLTNHKIEVVHADNLKTVFDNPVPYEPFPGILTDDSIIDNINSDEVEQ